MKHWYKHILLLVNFILLTSCTTPLKIKIEAERNLNPDEYRHSLPVEIIIYQLNDDQLFKQADFQQLWQADRNTLGDSLLSRHEINVAPHSTHSITLKNNNAIYIAAIAIFRNPIAGHWRAIKNIGKGIPLSAKHITIYLRGNHIAFR